MPTLYDHLGRPVDLAALKEEQATPQVSGVRQHLSGHPSKGLTPGKLARLLLDAEEGDPTAYLELAEDMEEKDLHYLSVLQTRKLAVAQQPIKVKPAGDDAQSKQHAEFIETWLNREPLQDEITEVLDAIGKGFSVLEIAWELDANVWQPDRLIRRDPRWFEFDREDATKLLLRETSGTSELAPFKYVVHYHKAKSGVPIRGGIARLAAWLYLFKNYSLKDWVIFAEIYGVPIRVGKYHAGASEEDRRKLLQAVTQIGTDAAAIVPDSMMLELIEAKATGNASVHKQLCEYIDAQLSKATLGQTLTTEVGDKGSYSAAKVHDEVRDDICRSDATQVAMTFNLQLVRPMIDLNFGPQKAYPQIVIGEWDRLDYVSIADKVKDLVDRGLRVSQAEVRDALGLREPDDDEDVLQPAGAGAAAADAPPAENSAHTHLPGCPACHAQEDDPSPDSFDELLAASIGNGEWEKVLRPVIAPAMDAVLGAEDLDDVRERLYAAFAQMDDAALAELLARAQFSSRLAGETDAPVTDDRG